MQTTLLKQSDVELLMADSSADTRAITATKVARQFTDGTLSQAELEIASEILRRLVQDAAVRVRKALSEHLKECPTVPYDVALSLARDVEAVALPMLEFSEVLTDQDLIDIVRSSGQAQQETIARRRTVSTEVSDALAETKNEEVVANLVGNVDAEISEGALNKILDAFPKSDTVHGLMVARSRLPVALTERLVGMVSYRLRQHLVAQQDVRAQTVTNIIQQSRERATLDLLLTDADSEELVRMVERLYGNGRLQPSLLLRALCAGGFEFFEAAIAMLARVPPVSAQALVRDPGPLGLKSICQKANISPLWLPAFRAAVEVARETGWADDEASRAKYSRQAIERVLGRYHHFRVHSLDDLVGRLSQQSGRAGTGAKEDPSALAVALKR